MGRCGQVSWCQPCCSSSKSPHHPAWHLVQIAVFIEKGDHGLVGGVERGLMHHLQTDVHLPAFGWEQLIHPVAALQEVPDLGV